MRASQFPPPHRAFSAPGRFLLARSMWKQAWDDYPLSAVLECARPACKIFRPADTSLGNYTISPTRSSSVLREGGPCLMLSFGYEVPANRMARPLCSLPAYGRNLPGNEAFRQHHDALPPAPADASSMPLVTAVLPSGICPGSDRLLPGHSVCEPYQDDWLLLSVDV